ncbi:MAG: hypothetical protein ACE5FN_04445 [Leptospirillia bacterium]
MNTEKNHSKAGFLGWLSACLNGRKGRMAAGILGVSLVLSVAGCGGGDSASHTATITVPADSDWGKLDPGTGPWSPTSPILVEVTDTFGGSTVPVPGVEITIQVGGVNITGSSMNINHGITQIASGVTTWTGTTDDHGTVTVRPTATATVACGGATDDISGSLSVGAWISNYATSWSADFTISCS